MQSTLQMHVREGLRRTHINITPCCLHSSCVTRWTEFPWGFPRSLHPETGLKGAGFAPAEALSTSYTAGLLRRPGFWNEQTAGIP